MTTAPGVPSPRRNLTRTDSKPIQSYLTAQGNFPLITIVAEAEIVVQRNMSCLDFHSFLKTSLWISYACCLGLGNNCNIHPLLYLPDNAMVLIQGFFMCQSDKDWTFTCQKEAPVHDAPTLDGSGRIIPDPEVQSWVQDFVDPCQLASVIPAQLVKSVSRIQLPWTTNMMCKVQGWPLWIDPWHLKDCMQQNVSFSADAGLLHASSLQPGLCPAIFPSSCLFIVIPRNYSSVCHWLKCSLTSLCGSS